MIAIAGALGCASLTGCVERRISITSDPSGARVWLNDQEVGETPVEVDFTWFGVYDVRLKKDGYEPLVTTAEAKAPLHEQPGIDFVAMAIPGTSRTNIAWHFTLEPSEGKAEGLLDRAKELRANEMLKAESSHSEGSEKTEGTDSPVPPSESGS